MLWSEVGCFGGVVDASEFWACCCTKERKLFKQLGNLFRGSLKWTRICNRTYGELLPRLLHVVVSLSCFWSNFGWDLQHGRIL